MGTAWKYWLVPCPCIKALPVLSHLPPIHQSWTHLWHCGVHPFINSSNPDFNWCRHHICPWSHWCTTASCSTISLSHIGRQTIFCLETTCWHIQHLITLPKCPLFYCSEGEIFCSEDDYTCSEGAINNTILSNTNNSSIWPCPSTSHIQHSILSSIQCCYWSYYRRHTRIPTSDHCTHPQHLGNSLWKWARPSFPRHWHMYAHWHQHHLLRPSSASTIY